MYLVICLVTADETKEKSYEEPEDRQNEGFGRRGAGAFYGLRRENLGGAGAGVEGVAEGG